jgi:hypothetical protein
MKKGLYALAMICAIVVSQGRTSVADEDLYITPVIQQTPVWCWAAVSEMVLDHYGFDTINPAGDYQCGVVAMLGGICNASCYDCMTGIGNTENLSAVLKQYQRIAKQVGADGTSFRPSLKGRLSARRIIEEIDAGNPIIAGISPSGFGNLYPPRFGEHVALIVGYEGDEDDLSLIVNDPFPFGMVGRDPYLQAGAEEVESGQYLISRDALVDALGYKDSIVFTD